MGHILSDAEILRRHPCFSKEAHHKFGRLHLPVAPACNVQCGYCTRKHDCANESRPGVTSRVLSADEAVLRVRQVHERDGRLSVVGIAGPGDPLANESTFEVMSALRRSYPELILCVSTNGLYLPSRLSELMEAGVSSLTVTINSVTADTAEKIYSWAMYKGARYTGRAGAALVLYNQWKGLKKACEAGLIVKVNTVLIPGINDAEIPAIAKVAGSMGAEIMNIMPLIPQAGFSHLPRPTHAEIGEMRLKCGGSIKQMTHCRQCRADALGSLGEDRDMETEALFAMIGEEYSESVL